MGCYVCRLLLLLVFDVSFKFGALLVGLGGVGGVLRRETAVANVHVLEAPWALRDAFGLVEAPARGARSLVERGKQPTAAGVVEGLLEVV